MNITEIIKKKLKMSVIENWVNPIDSRDFNNLMAYFLANTGYWIINNDGMKELLKPGYRSLHEFKKFLAYGGVQPIICITPFPLWNTVTIGHRTEIEWKRDIVKYQIEERTMLAQELIKTIKPAVEPEDINLVLVHSVDLGFDINEEVSADALYARAFDLGYELCPAEMVFEVIDLIEKDDVLREKYIRIAMKPIWMKKDEWNEKEKPWIFSVNPSKRRPKEDKKCCIYAVNVSPEKEFGNNKDFTGQGFLFRIPKVPLKKVRISQ